MKTLLSLIAAFFVFSCSAFANTAFWADDYAWVGEVKCMQPSPKTHMLVGVDSKNCSTKKPKSLSELFCTGADAPLARKWSKPGKNLDATEWDRVCRGFRENKNYQNYWYPQVRDHGDAQNFFCMQGIPSQELEGFKLPVPEENCTQPKPVEMEQLSCDPKYAASDIALHSPKVNCKDWRPSGKKSYFWTEGGADRITCAFGHPNSSGWSASWTANCKEPRPATLQQLYCDPTYAKSSRKPGDNYSAYCKNWKPAASYQNEESENGQEPAATNALVTQPEATSMPASESEKHTSSAELGE